MNLPSKLIADTVQAFASLPGIGKKTALRLTLHLLNQEPERVKEFAATIARMREEVRFCSRCHNICDQDKLHPEGTQLCSICANPARHHHTICVVEGLRDLIAIESTQQYNGTYHILGGPISPVDGIGPEDLNMDTLLQRALQPDTQELIMALSPTIEGDTTIFYISRQLEGKPVRITTIARGIAFGGELEYVDEFTLSRSLANRMPYENYLVNK
jgi:recombination protein RecR